MNDPLSELEEQRRRLEFGKRMWRDTQGLSVEIRPEHFDPVVQAQIREELARYQREDEPEKYIPVPRNKLTRFRSQKILAQLEVSLQEPDHFDQRPRGFVKINDERFRLVFQSYQIMMTDLWQCSQKEWREWIYSHWNSHFKSIDAVVDPNNANQMYPTSALYFDYDPFGRMHPEVENAFIIISYDDNSRLQMNGAILILDRIIKPFGVLRRTKDTWRTSLTT